MTPLRLLGASSRRTLFRPAGSSGPNGADAIHGDGTGATGDDETWPLRCLRGELLCRGRDLVPVPRRRLPGQSQRVTVVARDDVHVEVEDRLPSLRSARVDEVDAVGPKPFGH